MPAPEILYRGPVTPAFGGALPPSGALPASLREIFPPSVQKAIEGIWGEIQSQALTPLFLAEPREGLAQTFRLVLPLFASYYLAATITIVTSIKEHLSALVDFGLEAMREALRTRAMERFGREPMVAALIGLHSMTLISKAALRQTIAEPAGRQLSHPDAETVSIAMAYWLAIFAVADAVFQEDPFAGRRENVATLAHWSRAYALKLYNVASREGLLQPPTRPSGMAPSRSTEEELQLADAGLDDYARLLEQHDEQTTGLRRRIK